MIIYRFKVFGVLAVLCLCITACASNPHPWGKPSAAMSFAHIGPVSLAVEDVVISDHVVQKTAPDRQAQLNAPKAGFQPEPYDVTRHFLDHKFSKAQAGAPSGDQGVFEIQIKRAESVYHYEAAKQAVGRWFELGGHDVYTVVIDLHLLATDTAQYNRQALNIKLRRELRLPEHFSIASRERRQAEMMELVVNDLNAEMNNAINNKFQF